MSSRKLYLRQKVAKLFATIAEVVQMFPEEDCELSLSLKLSLSKDECQLVGETLKNYLEEAGILWQVVLSISQERILIQKRSAKTNCLVEHQHRPESGNKVVRFETQPVSSSLGPASKQNHSATSTLIDDNISCFLHAFDTDVELPKDPPLTHREEYLQKRNSIIKQIIDIRKNLAKTPPSIVLQKDFDFYKEFCEQAKKYTNDESLIEKVWLDEQEFDV